MRKFKVLNCKTEKIAYKRMSRRDENDNLVWFNQYYTVNAGEQDHKGNTWYPGAYGNENIKVGDIIEVEEHLADKAARNPDFEEVVEEVSAPVKKKRGRPPKVKADAA